jgi:hypothetical protein
LIITLRGMGMPLGVSCYEEARVKAEE